jgi:hypothetical protein
MTEKTPDDFNWVAARSACSLGAVFELLKQQVQQDTEARQRILTATIHRHYGFRFLSASSRSFSVLTEGNHIHCIVDFKLGDNAIQVGGSGFEGVPNFEATLTLDDEGECRAKIGEREFQLWQVRKMALETLFFRAY